MFSQTLRFFKHLLANLAFMLPFDGMHSLHVYSAAGSMVEHFEAKLTLVLLTDIVVGSHMRFIGVVCSEPFAARFTRLDDYFLVYRTHMSYQVSAIGHLYGTLRAL
uniref:Putative secreted peptide n=1 Tax=Anopheles braziliensis TaxID=58242 RepID=A0A2M3ZUX5_9DIPT